jgi:DNA-directed RNA polymerase specialized sigma24 family protein
MSQNKDNKMPFEESKKQWKALIDRICSDDDFAYHFFHEKCRPLFSKILWKLYGNNADYDELVNELYLVLKKPDSNGEMWHALKTYDYRTSPFDWIKTVAVRHFYTPSKESFIIPDTIIESGMAEEMFSKLRKAVYRKFMCFKYLELLDDESIAAKLNLERTQLPALSRKAVKQLKSIVENQYPEYYSVLFQKSEVVEIDIDSQYDSSLGNDEVSQQELHLDVYQYLDAMPNKYYRKVIKALFIDDKAPEVLAMEMGTPVSNIYNIKSRGLDQLRDVALFSNEICNLEKYIKLISDDRNRFILSSIFIEKKDYDVVCSELKITEVQFKKFKKDAIKEVKNKIFKAKS